MHHDHIQDLAFKIHGKTGDALLVASDTGYHGMLESKTYKRAIPFEVEVEQIDLNMLEIIGDKVGSPANIATAAIHADDNGKPGAKLYDIPTFSELEDPNEGEGSWSGDIFTFQSEFVSEETLSKGSYWIVLPEIGTGTGNYYKWIQATGQGGSKRSDDGGSTWENETSDYGIWFKLWATASYEYFAADGYWVSPKFTIGANDDYDKVYWSRMVPAGATAKLYIDEDESGSWAEITSSTPYSVTADTTIIQFKVELAIGTANFTPVVDSILVTYTKENDEGDILRAGNVNGELFLSRIDDDGDSSDEFTLVLAKTNTIHFLSEPFYDYLPIAEETTLAIGKNTNNDLNVFELDEGDTWYAGGSYPKTIDVEIETGQMMNSEYIKQFRRFWCELSGDVGGAVALEITATGAEQYGSEEIIEKFNEMIFLEETSILKPYLFSLPDRMEGKFIKVKFSSQDADWNLHAFGVEAYNKRRKINVSQVVNYDKFVAWIKGDRPDGEENIELAVFDMVAKEIVDTYSYGTGTYQFCGALLSQRSPGSTGYLYAVSAQSNTGGGTGKLHVFSLASDGSLTLVSSSLTLDCNNFYPCHLDIWRGQILFALTTASDGKYGRLYKIDISDPANPSIISNLPIVSPGTQANYSCFGMQVIRDKIWWVRSHSGIWTAEAGAFNATTRIVASTYTSNKGAIAYNDILNVVAISWCKEDNNSNLWFYDSDCNLLQEDLYDDKYFIHSMSWGKAKNKLYVLANVLPGSTSAYELWTFDKNLDRIATEELTASWAYDHNIFVHKFGYPIILKQDTSNGSQSSIEIRNPDGTEFFADTENSNAYCTFKRQCGITGFGKSR